MGKLLLFHTEMISAFIPLGKCVSWGELQIDAKIQILNFSYIYMKSGSMQVLRNECGICEIIYLQSPCDKLWS